MKPIGRRNPCVLGFLVSLLLAALPNSSKACPKPCACYVPTEVHCTFRYLTVIPRQIQAGVERINLGYNSLSKLLENDFGGLKNLELLMLHSNEIQTIHESAFNDLSSLQVLKMSYNKVKTVHKNTFHGLKNMVRLHIDHNKLEFLNPESFYGLTSLKLIHLEGNMLSQLHPDTFVTLRYIQIFKTSSIKQIYLSDNQLSSLSKEMFSYMTELEGIYLHGNPWSCDCNLQWLTEWAQQSRDMIKCKRDRSYPNGQQCPVCVNPKNNKGKSLAEIAPEHITCAKPTIENIYKTKHVTNEEEGGFTAVSAKDFVAPMGSIILNMTDQAGNEANLACNVQTPTKMFPITMDTKAHYTTLRTTFSSFLVCNIDYDHIQKLWGILAMYSDSPMKLKRDLLLTKTPFISYKYRQSVSDDDVFTDIEAELRTEPSWLMQDLLTLQLDRTATTLSTLHIRYLVDVYVTIPNLTENPSRSNWVMILNNNQTKTEHSAVIGGTVEMDCQVLGEPTPAIEWILPDGNKIRAPYASEEGRITLTKNGKFILKAADSFDTGVYHCIGTNYIDADVLSFRITVVSADVEEENVNGAEFSVSNGDVLYLPCESNSIPDASVSWILPDHSVLRETSRNKLIFTNGTLKVQDVTQRDRGYFRCLAANKYGLDMLIFKVSVKETKINILNKKTLSDHSEDEHNEGSGKEEFEEDSKHAATGKAISRKTFPDRKQSGDTSTNLNGKVNRKIGVTPFQGRNTINKRLRGQRRQFNQSTRKIDPQRWTEILEKTKQNSIITKMGIQAVETSVKEENVVESVSGEVEEPSGDDLLPVEERYMILTTKHSTVSMPNGIPTAKTITDIGISTSSGWTTMEISIPPRAENERFRIQKENTGITVNYPVPTTSGVTTSGTSHPKSKHHFETITHATIQDVRNQPTTRSTLNNTSIEVLTKPPTTLSILHATFKDVTTNSILASTPSLLPVNVKPQSVINDLTTTFNSLTATPQNVITNPMTTSNYLYTSQDAITTQTSSYLQATSPNSATNSPTPSSYFHAASQLGITEPTTVSDYLHVTSQDVITNLPSTSSYLNDTSQEVLTNHPSTYRHLNGSPQNSPTNSPTTSSYQFVTPQDVVTNSPTTSSSLHVTFQNAIGKAHTTSHHVIGTSKGILFRNPTTYSPLNSTVREVLKKPPVTHEDIVANTLTDPNQLLTAKDISNSQISANIPDVTAKGVTNKPLIISSLQHAASSNVLSKPPTNVQRKKESTTYSLPSTMSKYSRQNLLYSQDNKLSASSKVHNVKVPNFSVTKDEVEKTNNVAIDSSTKSSANLFLSQTEIGSIYFHSTQKIITPQLPAGSTIITHQQIQIVKDVTPFVPTVRRYGRRRISGKRRIIRPDRIPNMRDHKFNFGKSDLREYSQGTPTQTRISELGKQKPFLYSTSPSSVSVPLPTEHAATTTQQNVNGKETSIELATMVQNIDTPSTSNYVTYTQSATQTTLKSELEKMLHFDTNLKVDVTHKPIMTTQITSTPAVGKDVYSSYTTDPPPTKPRAASKILRRKIPWHRIFGNNQILQNEILRKLRKNTQRISAITTTTPITSVASLVSKASTTYLPIDTITSNVMENTVLPKTTTSKLMIRTETTLKSITYLTNSNAAQTSEDEKIIANAGIVSTTAAPKSFITADMTARQKILKRKRPHKKNTFNNSVFLNTWKSSSKSNMSTQGQSVLNNFVLKTSTTSPQQESPQSHTITQIAEILPTSVTEAMPPSSSIANDILLTTRKDYFWSKNVNAPKSSLQPLHNRKRITKPLPNTYPETSEKRHATTSGQAMNKNTPLKYKFTTIHHNTKPTASYNSDIFTTILYPTLTTFKITSSVVDPSPILTTWTAQPPAVIVQKKANPNLEKRPNPKIQEVTESSTAMAVNTPTVLTPSGNYNSASNAAKQNGMKSWSEKTSIQETTTGLLILEPPSHIDPSKPRIIGGKAASFTVLANSDAFIPCEASGNPAPTIHWTKVSSGTFVSKTRRGNKMEIFMNGTLSIPSVSIQDRGQYLCLATNQHGSDRLLVTLSIITYPPRIVQGRSKEITVHSGSSVSVKCQAEGRPFPTITWILANETIASESSVTNKQVIVQSDGTLTIKEVSIYDRGIYKCLATNPAGVDTFTVRIQVIAAPPLILEEKRQNVVVVPGETLKLPCTAKGNPQPSIHWVVFDGTKVKPLQYVNAKLFLFSNGTLYIRNVASADSGNYECIATSSTGSERRVVNLMVEQSDTIPKIVKASPKATEMNFGDKLALNCSATGEPKPRIIWRLPSKAVVDQWHRMGSRIQVYPNGSLIVESVNEKDAGDYLCVARNKMGDDLILMKVSVTMIPAKIIQKQYLTKQVPFGKDFKVDCKASGSPLPEITWSLPDGTMINNVLQADDSGRRIRRYILFDNGTLYLNKVGITEEGDYTCYAENTLGKDEMKVHITVVTAAPRIKLNQKAHYSVRAGESAALDCEAIGEPKPKTFWLLPSSDMIAASHDRYVLHENGSLSISQVKLLDAGEYMCVARNAAGDDTKLLKLDVQSKPPLINGLYSNKSIIRDTAIKHSRKLITCRAEGTPPPHIMWIMPDNIYLTAPYHGSRIMVHKNGSLEIRNVRPSDTAEFTCVARNDGGESMLVVQLEVLEMLRRPMFKNPFNEKVIAKPGKMAILNCSADGNPPPEIIWLLPNGTRFLNGQKLTKYHAGNNGTFIIYSPTKEDAGKYRCAARNKIGYIEKLIILEVGQKPTILTHPRGPIKNIIGDALSLHCLSDGTPRPNIIWTLPSGYVIDRPHVNGKYMLLENGTLVIRETSIHDRGNYLCKAKNNAGEATISVPVMIIAYPPRITNKPPQNIHTRVGSAVHLNCMAIGIPKPEITWELPDLSVLSTASKGRPTGTELLHPQGTLVVQNPRSSDSGMYRCIAKSPLGTDISSTYLKVI
ncbi:hypothetical protein FKM82_004042 [Ascaphus truei]